MYKYKSTCRFKMLVYVGSDILEIRPQQIIESDVELDYPYLKPIESKKKVSNIKIKLTLYHKKEVPIFFALSFSIFGCAGPK